jgi:hypothetical protein
LVIAGILGWSRASPGANTALPQLIRVATDELAGNRSQSPVISHNSDHNADMTRITRVRRRPSMRWEAGFCLGTTHERGNGGQCDAGQHRLVTQGVRV